MIRRPSLSYIVFIRGLDALLAVLALIIAARLRLNLNIGALGQEQAFDTPLFLYIIAPALWQIAFQLLGVYDPAVIAWQWRELQRVIFGHAVAGLLFFGGLYLIARDYSRLQSVYFLVLLLIGLVTYRILLRILSKITHNRIGKRRAVVIVGTDASAVRIGKTIMLYSWTGLYLLGYVKHDPRDEEPEVGKVLGIVDDLPMLAEQHHIAEVLITLKSPDYAYLGRLITSLQFHVINIRLAPDYSDLAYFHVSVDNFGGIPLIGLREAVLSPSQRLAKRLTDIAISGTAIVLGWPVFLAVAAAIRLETPGPALFRQERIGEHGRRFMMYKFRSMTHDADKVQLTDSVDHKRREDPRVTRIGRFIRRTSLDELPQFLNILRGDMSVVGPRPEMPWLVDKYDAWQRKRFEVPQGLTGWWQITGRADKPMYLNTEDDLFYIRNYSFWLDMQIIVRTVLIVVTGRGAF